MVITSIRISGIFLLQRMNYERAAEIGLWYEVALWKDGITTDMWFQLALISDTFAMWFIHMYTSRFKCFYQGIYIYIYIYIYQRGDFYVCDLQRSCTPCILCSIFHKENLVCSSNLNASIHTNSRDNHFGWHSSLLLLPLFLAPNPQYGSMQRQTAWAIAIMSCLVWCVCQQQGQNPDSYLLRGW